MTVRVTTLKGLEAGRYYTERLPGYYLNGQEPPGRWWGRAASDLGLSGQVDPEAFLAVMAGEDLVSAEVLGRRYGEGSVRGYDATFSAPKSVSVLFALGGEQIREQVVEAHDSAVGAVLGWVEDHAHTRLRQQGDVVHVDAEGIMVGVFRQHTSRRLDPQLHTHAVIANRVRGPDGRWLALDARPLICDQRTLSALYHAALRAELTRRLGVEWEIPENGIAEIAGMPKEVLAGFSQRTADIERRLVEKLDRFDEEFRREPTVKERWRMEREAVLDSRPAKPRSPSLAELRQEWQQRVWGMGFDPARLVGETIGRQRRLGGIHHRAARIISRGLQTLVEKQSSWRPAELVRELAAATPTNATADAKELTEYIDNLADAVTKTRCADISRPTPDGVARRRDGRPITEPAVDRALTTQAILDEEDQLIAWAEQRLAGDVPRTRWPSRSGAAACRWDVSIRVGDEVVTRRNNRRLRTDRGLMVKNRDHWTITNIHRNGSITIAGRTGTIRLPADYVTRDLELGYAQTSYASQGRIVDVALLLVDTPADSRGVYTPMTRGREANHAYVVTEDNQTALDVLAQTLARDWIDQPALARRLQLDPHHSRQVTSDWPGDEIEEHSRQLEPGGPGDETGELTKSRTLELIAERKARRKRVERSRGLGL
jgi:conjugative relaxase-like TrwC/TraI family protein